MITPQDNNAITPTGKLSKPSSFPLPLIVQKYGGSSLARPEQIQRIARNVVDRIRQGQRFVIVVSAMGKSTDQLIELAYQICKVPHHRELDMLLTAGERISMALMSMAINDLGCKAISFTGSQSGILTDSSHLNARIIDIRPIRVESELARGVTPILAGFQGVCADTKEITTLGRGGTDTTAVAMAAHLKAARCEILKDVDGVYSADPHRIPQAVHRPHLHYMQLLEMTYWGAKVLHHRSVELAYRLQIPLLIGPAHPDDESTGKKIISTRYTLINGETPMYEQSTILSVNSHQNVRWLQGSAATSLQESYHNLSQYLSKHHIPWPQILDVEKHNEQWRFLITAPQETLQALQNAGTLDKLNTDFQLDSQPLSTATATAQGSHSSDFTLRVLEKFNKRNIHIHKLLFSPMSVSVLVDKSNLDLSLQLLHD